MNKFARSFNLLGFGFFLLLSLALLGCTPRSGKEVGDFGATPNPDAVSTPIPGSSGKLSGLSGPPPRKTDDQRAVTIEVDWVAGWEAVGQEPIGFQVQMDTHSVDLDRYNMMELAVLRTADGAERGPAAWENSEGGGHHRSGVLKFSAADPGGKPVITRDTKTVDLIIREVAGIKERLFRWELGE